VQRPPLFTIRRVRLGGTVLPFDTVCATKRAVEVTRQGLGSWVVAGAKVRDLGMDRDNAEAEKPGQSEQPEHSNGYERVDGRFDSDFV